MLGRKLHLTLISIIAVTTTSWCIQFEIITSGAENVALGGSGAGLLKDVVQTLLNPATLSLDKSLVTIYYEANSSVNVGDIFELYNHRFVFDPANIGISVKLNDSTRASFLLTTYIHDIDVPETKYRVLLFGLSRKALPYLLVGASLGPVLGINETSTLFSFLVVGGTTIRIEDTFNTSLVVRSPFSVTYSNPYYGAISQTFPPIVSWSSSFLPTENIILSCAIEIVLLNNLSASVGDKEIFTPRENVNDFILPKFGIAYYDEASGYRVMAGFFKSQIETISKSLPQYHLTLGTTFFIKVPPLNEFEINFCVNDCILLNLLQIAPQNIRRVSLHVSGEVRL